MSDVMDRLVDTEQRRRLEHRFGAHVSDWLSGLSDTIAELADEWGLTVRGTAPGKGTSVLVRASLADGREGVLKLSPDQGRAGTEAGMLRMWAPSGRVPRVWALDESRGAILMERIEGHSFATRDVLPPMEAVGTLIRDLHSIELPPEEMAELRPLMARVQFIFDHWGRERTEGPAADVVSPSLMHRGYCCARELAHEDIAEVPLHGDLRPRNVIDGGEHRGLVAVDPRACAGDGAADTVDWLLWKITDPGQTRQRAGELSRVMGTDSERMVGWARSFAPCLAVSMVNHGRGHGPTFDAVMELAHEHT